jgi:hypothetical protein
LETNLDAKREVERAARLASEADEDAEAAARDKQAVVDSSDDENDASMVEPAMTTDPKARQARLTAFKVALAELKAYEQRAARIFQILLQHAVLCANQDLTIRIVTLGVGPSSDLFELLARTGAAPPNAIMNTLRTAIFRTSEQVVAHAFDATLVERPKKKKFMAKRVDPSFYQFGPGQGLGTYRAPDSELISDKVLNLELWAANVGLNSFSG